MTTSAETAIETVIPDLRDIPLDRIGSEGGPGLARAVAEYRERMARDGVPLSSFQARI